MRESIVTKRVDVELTREDKAEYLIQITEDVLYKEKLENAKKEANKRWGEKIKYLEESLSKASRIVNSGVHAIDVDFNVVYDFEAKLKRYVAVSDEYDGLEVEPVIIPMAEMQEELGEVLEEEPEVEEEESFEDF